MLIILSPAKTLDFEKKSKTNSHSLPAFTDKAAIIMKELKKLDQSQLGKRMSISQKLAGLNHIRHQAWTKKHDESNGKQAIYAFRGEVYNGINIDDFNEKEILFAQKHLRIISGLYGILRPLDLIQPYRLEMGTKLPVGNHKNLYAFWGSTIAEKLNNDMPNDGPQHVINLASNEYYKAVDQKSLRPRVITPVFKELKNGTYKVISIYAKKARGSMTAWIIKNRVKNIETIKNFDQEGYMFDVNQSNNSNWVFTRG